MGLDLTTFILEIINFLVLLWLLTHFLYRPLQAAIRQRQQQAEAARQELARQRAGLEAEAAALAQQRQTLAASADTARQRLEEEIEQERQRRLAALATELAAARAQAETRLAAQQAQQASARDAEAAQRAEGFLRSYLARLAGPALECSIGQLFLSDLAALPEAERQALRSAPADGPVEIATAFTPTASQQQQVEAAIADLLGRQPTFIWRIDQAIIAGLSVRLDGHLLEASLARSLDALRQAAPEAA